MITCMKDKSQTYFCDVEIARLTKQRDELVAALETIADSPDFADALVQGYARAALAAVKGEG
jgi:hypothetical protein